MELIDDVERARRLRDDAIRARSEMRAALDEVDPLVLRPDAGGVTAEWDARGVLTALAIPEEVRRLPAEEVIPRIELAFATAPALVPSRPEVARENIVALLDALRGGETRVTDWRDETGRLVLVASAGRAMSIRCDERWFAERTAATISAAVVALARRAAAAVGVDAEPSDRASAGDPGTDPDTASDTASDTEENGPLRG